MWAVSDRTKENGLKLNERKFRLDVRKKFFTQRMAKPWHCCPELWVSHLWRCPRPGWMGPWTTWDGGWQPAHSRGWN